MGCCASRGESQSCSDRINKIDRIWDVENSDNPVNAAGDEDQDGISNLAALMMGINPVKQCDGGFAVAQGSSGPEINAWEVPFVCCV